MMLIFTKGCSLSIRRDLSLLGAPGVFSLFAFPIGVANYSRIKQHRLARRIVISLYDKDFEKMEDLMSLKKHIDMECEMGTFSYSKIKSEMVS
ncbi:hypothetical protein ACFCYN_10890 [Gottfriedia sp. NPDC056225]|uniref:hypothetical protein n=1 Tax=Gottfriedia sp. NPDC056225 TaxID=3345751 RepID=UPI0035DDA0F5